MNDRPPPPSEEIRRIIDRVDEICRESERTRSRADDSMRRRPIWPDTPDDNGSPDDPGLPDNEDDTH
jgi:hypothetical protein